MHQAVLNWVSRALAEHGERSHFVDVLDIGGRDINGSARDLFPKDCKYLSVDIAHGPGVDIVEDACTWRPVARFDIVVCLNVFEHVERWRDMIETAHYVLRPGGLFICSAAGPGYAPHSGRAATHALEPDEWYKNITKEELTEALTVSGFGSLSVVTNRMRDVQGWAVRTL